ncbi:MAG: hypothetical protein LBH05_01685 [Deferribacteraceae bacterium]|jgi:hypothetical protein|nr:hypothetical protein [Deferribacteraceae bacterium]
MSKKGDQNTPTKSILKRPVFIAVAAVIVAALAFALVAIQIMVNRKAETKLREFVTGAELPYDVSWSKVSYKLLTRRLYISNASIGAAKADRITVSGIKKGSPLPEFAVIGIRNLNIPVIDDFFGRYYIPLNDMGYHSITGSVNFTSELGPDKQLNLVVNNMSLNDFGVVNTKMTIDQADAQLLSDLLRNLKDKTVLSAWVSFENSGFMERMIALFAAETNTPANKAKAKVMEGLNRRIHTRFKTDSVQRSSLTQLYRFIENPKKITSQISGGQKELLVKDIFQPAHITGWRGLATWFTELPQEITAN